jgi:hypothetical protein
MQQQMQQQQLAIQQQMAMQQQMMAGRPGAGYPNPAAAASFAGYPGGGAF